MIYSDLYQQKIPGQRLHRHGWSSKAKQLIAAEGHLNKLQAGAITAAEAALKAFRSAGPGDPWIGEFWAMGKSDDCIQRKHIFKNNLNIVTGTR